MVESKVVDCVARMLGFSVGAESGVAMDDALEGGRLGMDSLDKVEVVMAVEEELEIELCDDDVAKCVTVGDLVALARRVAGEVVE